jgi:exopolysaccharide biosynthesis polyprenyl glycosylphosphotransferase
MVNSITIERPDSATAAQSRAEPLRWPSRQLRPLPAILVLSDVVMLGLGVLAGGTVAVATLLPLAVAPLTLGVLRLYRSRLSPSALDDLPYVAVSVAVAALAGLAYDDLRGGIDGSAGFILQMAASLGFIVCGRGVIFGALRWARRSGLIDHRCVVIGAGHVGRQLAQTLMTHREFGLNVVGFVDERTRPTRAPLPAPLLGDYANLPEQMAREGIRVAIVAFGSMRERQLIDVLRTCDRSKCEMFFIPRLYEVHSTTRDMEQIWGIPLVRVRRAAHRRLSWRLKRLTDIVLAGMALIVCAPVMAACALAVRIEGGPGVIFKQHRVGIGDRQISVLKFRSLKPSDDAESGTTWSVANDDRIGPVGRLLRRTSLDELPQLWNIVRGDMSIVGPRPERPHFVEQFNREIPRYADRHRVQAGLTGWAQIHGLRGDTSIEDRAIFDNYYIENWSLWNDFKIMVRTVHQVFRRGEH